MSRKPRPHLTSSDRDTRIAEIRERLWNIRQVGNCGRSDEVRAYLAERDRLMKELRALGASW